MATQKYNRQIDTLNKIIIITTFILFVIIALTPFIIKRGYSIFDEEASEVILIGFLITIIYLSQFFQREFTRKLLLKIKAAQAEKLETEKQLNESFKYIGKINVLIQEINKYFLDNKTYPETKSDLKKIILVFAQKILAIIPVDFVFLRFIQIESAETITESSLKRSDGKAPQINISNKMLIKKPTGNKNGTYWISSTHKNTTVKVYAIFKNYKINSQQKILIKALLDDLEMVFIIYKSRFLKRNNPSTNSK